MSDPAPKTPPPDKKTLKGTVLWCARWLVGGWEFYRGPVEVEIRAAREGMTLTVGPRKECDGLAEPEPLAPKVGEQATPSELLAALFSRDEERILAEMLGEGPYKAGGVQKETKIVESKFWVLWSNLQHRGIVGDAADGEGFVIGPAWVKELVRARTEGRSAA